MISSGTALFAPGLVGDLASAARQTPELADLAVVDPGDPAPVLDAQKRWSLAVDTPPTGLPSPGDEIEYTIFVSNTGSATATNVRCASSASALSSGCDIGHLHLAPLQPIGALGQLVPVHLARPRARRSRAELRSRARNAARGTGAVREHGEPPLAVARLPQRAGQSRGRLRLLGLASIRAPVAKPLLAKRLQHAHRTAAVALHALALRVLAHGAGAGLVGLGE
jgi:hypothetical protein